MNTVEKLRSKVFAGRRISREDAFELSRAPLRQLCETADDIRKRFCGDAFDLCCIINAKSGKCGEDCKFCAQSSFYGTVAEQYPLLAEETVLQEAQAAANSGILRFSIVTSGRRLCWEETDKLCGIVRAVRERVGISVCVSAGLLSAEQFSALKSAGVSRAHCNLETSARFFPQVCTTHTYGDKIAAISAAKNAGLEICSGGIIGLGESVADRIDMALSLRAAEVRSVPVNFLYPVPGTPFSDNAPLSEGEKLRTVALFRFILPDAAIRLAGGRRLMPDKGEACFKSGANACITGNMLTTDGVSVSADKAMLGKLGYEVKTYG